MLVPVCLCEDCGVYFKNPSYINNCWIAKHDDGVTKVSRIFGTAKCPECKGDREVVVMSWVPKTSKAHA